MRRPSIRRYYVKARVAQAAVHAALAGVGSFRREWPLPPPAQPLPLDTLTDEIHAWIKAQLSQVRTPYGVDNCMVTLKLIARPNGTWHRRWSTELPSFVRNDPGTLSETLAMALQQLPRDAYPDATGLEIALLSLGDIVAFSDKT